MLRLFRIRTKGEHNPRAPLKTPENDNGSFRPSTTTKEREIPRRSIRYSGFFLRRRNAAVASHSSDHCSPSTCSHRSSNEANTRRAPSPATLDFLSIRSDTSSPVGVPPSMQQLTLHESDTFQRIHNSTPISLLVTDIEALCRDFCASEDEPSWESGGGLSGTKRRLSTGTTPPEQLIETPESVDWSIADENRPPTAEEPKQLNDRPSLEEEDEGINRIIQQVQNAFPKSDEEQIDTDTKLSPHILPSYPSSLARLLYDSKDPSAGEAALGVPLISCLRKAVFEMYCLLSECPICLSALGTCGGPSLNPNTTTDSVDPTPSSKTLSRIKVALTRGPSSNEPPRIELVRFAGTPMRDSASAKEDGERPRRRRHEVAILPCGHQFCRNCVDDLVSTRALEQYGDLEAAPEKMRIRCPLCRKKIKCTNVVTVTA